MNLTKSCGQLSRDDACCSVYHKLESAKSRNALHVFALPHWNAIKLIVTKIILLLYCPLTDTFAFAVVSFFLR